MDRKCPRTPDGLLASYHCPWCFDHYWSCESTLHCRECRKAGRRVRLREGLAPLSGEGQPSERRFKSPTRVYP